MILHELETALRERINNRDWLDEDTRQRALSKLDSIEELVAYPEAILDNTFLDAFYSRVRLSYCMYSGSCGMASLAYILFLSCS